ncbi:MAG TPA: hypothetical protein PKW80_01795 [Bacteroidales bacterium]|nr:hypothetical protein [Bacteroidales bacterium]
MKNLTIILVCLFTLVIVFSMGCKNKNLACKEINFQLDTLSKNGKATIEHKLSRESGVLYVKAHLKKKVVTIVFDTIIGNQSQLAGTLEKMGYVARLTGPVIPGN